MAIENNWYNNCEYLTGGDHKWNDMLFKLLDHSIDEDLADGC